MLTPNENLILAQLKEGNEKAYKQLFDSHYVNLVIYCQSLSGNKALAEDIVQETFIRIWNNRKSLEITSSLKSYLYRSVYNNFIKEYTKKIKTEEILIDLKREALDSLIDLDKEIYDRKIKLIEAAIEQLPKKCKKVFLMSKIEGYKYKEIAFQLSISEKAVEKHISRAIAKIRETLIIKNSILLLSFIVNKLHFQRSCLK